MQGWPVTIFAPRRVLQSQNRVDAGVSWNRVGSPGDHLPPANQQDDRCGRLADVPKVHRHAERVRRRAGRLSQRRLAQLVRPAASAWRAATCRRGQVRSRTVRVSAPEAGRSRRRQGFLTGNPRRIIGIRRGRLGAKCLAQDLAGRPPGHVVEIAGFVSQLGKGNHRVLRSRVDLCGAGD